MADNPPILPEDEQFTACPYCTMQVPIDATECPHCRKIMPPSEELIRAYEPKKSKIEKFRRLLVDDPRFGWISKLWTRYSRWIKVAGPVFGGLALLFLVYGAWVDYDVNIVPNPRLPIEAKKDKKDRVDVLTVFVTNRGEDIPDLSLKSIGVVVEFVYRDGRREKKTIFPKTEHHGEGALLNGETGKYEMSVPSTGLKEVTLRSEIVDLGMGRTLVPPGGRRVIIR
jgi:hypothetical protein